MNLNINDYTFDELLDFLEIKENSTNLSIINSKIDSLIASVAENKNLTDFLEKAKTKITSDYIKLNSLINSNTETSNSLIYDSINNNEESSDEESNNEESNNQESSNEESTIQQSTIQQSNNEQSTIQQSNNEQSSNEDYNISNIKTNNNNLFDLLDPNFFSKKIENIYLNLNTANRNLSTQILNTINTSLDSGNSIFILPNIYKNIKELNLIDISIDYNSINLISSTRNNNTFEISYNNLANPITITIYPYDNTENSLKTSINNQLNNDISNIKFDICNNYAYFDFTKYYDISDNSNNTFEFIFQPNSNNYSLLNVLGFVQGLSQQNKQILNINYNTKTNNKNIFPTDASYILLALSPIDLKLDNIYLALDEHYKNTTQNNNLLLHNNQLSSHKILAKLKLHNYTYIDNKVYGEYIIPSENVIKDYNNTRIYEGLIDIYKIKISLYDHYGNNLFLNYKNFQLTLRLKKILNYLK